MTVLAYGAEKVRDLELALGGKPPKKSGDQAAAELTRHIHERFQQRKAFWGKIDPLLKRARAPLLELIKADERATAAAAELKSILKSRREKPPRKLKRVKIEPRMVAGSGFWLKVPPYDNPWQVTKGDVVSISSDNNAGTYSFGMTGNNGSSSAGAGLAIWFFATEEDPQQRVAALVDYDFTWLDASTWDTAHNDGSTNIWVWGDREQKWVGQQGFFPSWSDGTGWLETHGSNGDGSDVSGRESLETFFPAAANSWYQVWIFSTASCDDFWETIFDWSLAQNTLSISVPFVVFGSL